MEEPIKSIDELKNSLEDITKTHLRFYKSRGGKSLQIIESLVEMANNREDKSEEFKVLYVTCGSDSGKLEVIKEALKILSEQNIQIVTLNLKEEPIFLKEEPSLRGDLIRFSCTGTIPFTRIRPYEELGRIPERNQQDFFKQLNRKIPIQGKSSKKGKNNQLGSNFHK